MHMPTVFTGGKLVILSSEDGRYIDLVLVVENYNERFDAVIDETVHRWKFASDLNFSKTIFEALYEAGYVFKVIEDYLVIDDPAG